MIEKIIILLCGTVVGIFGYVICQWVAEWKRISKDDD